MITELKKRSVVAEIGENYSIRNRYLLSYMAEAALVDSERAGFTLQSVLETGNSWVLGKIRLELDRPIFYGVPVSISTWHKGTEKQYGYRDYHIMADGVKAVSAVSVWSYANMKERKAIDAPENTDELFSTEEQSACDFDIKNWKPSLSFSPDYSTGITTRSSDFDPLSHVNNAVYFDYIETLWNKSGMAEKTIKAITIQYIREINKRVDRVEANIAPMGQNCLFSICSDISTVHAAGEIEYE